MNEGIAEDEETYQGLPTCSARREPRRCPSLGVVADALPVGKRIVVEPFVD